MPPKSTVWDSFSRREREGTIERVDHVLYVAVRGQAGREASPTTAITVGRSSLRIEQVPEEACGRLRS